MLSSERHFILRLLAFVNCLLKDIEMGIEREFSCSLLELIDQGMLDPIAAVHMCVQYMSEDEVKDMCRANDLNELLMALQ